MTSSGVALLSFAALLLQVALTRLCSAALNYHLTFLIVGAALLGTGAGGTWVALRMPPAPNAALERRRLARLAVFAAGAMALVGAAFAWTPIKSLGSAGTLVALLVAYPLFALPYGAVGAASALALRLHPERQHVNYAASLLGAAVGCVGAVVLIDGLGPPWAVAIAAAACIVAAVRFAPLGPDRRVAGGVVAVALATALFRLHEPNVIYAKPLASFLDPILYPDSLLLNTRWDATSRVDVFESPGAPLLWHTPTRGREPLPELRGITIDADAMTAAARAELGRAVSLVRRLPTSVPFVYGQRDRVLVIGSGGGMDVEAALAFGARQVDAVEVNRGVAAAVLGPLAGFTDDIYRRPGVRLTIDDGRSFLRRAAGRGDRYDAIVLTAVDSWAALTAGAYSLAESTLYTREAFDAYYERLNEGGVLAVSRWYTRPPREMHRLAELSRLTIERAGGDATSQVMLLRAGQFGTFGTLMVKRGPFTALEVQNAQIFGRDNGYGLVYTPGDPSGEFAPILAGLEMGETDGRVPTDDRPFFFDHTPWLHVLSGRSGWPLPQGHAVLIVALLQAVCLATASVLLPMRHGIGPKAGAWRAVLYFSAIGFAFAVAEMALLQRAALLIGRPAIALAVVIAGMLAGAGFGSLALGLRSGSPRIALVAGAGALWVIAPLSLAVTQLAGAWVVEGRALLTFLVCAGVAFPLGVGMPGGLRALPADVAPWAWGVNGAGAVVGTALAVILAMDLGVGATLVIAGLGYGAAVLVLPGLFPSDTANFQVKKRALRSKMRYIS